MSLGAHALIPFAFLKSTPPPTLEAFDPIPVTLAPPPERPPEPTPEPGGSGAAGPAQTPQAPPRAVLRPPVLPPPPQVQPLPVTPAPAPPAPVVATVSDAQLVGARTAGSGGGSGVGDGSGAGVGSGSQPCDMVRRLQAALRRDPEVRSAVRAAHESSASGRALLVWDGDWIQSPGQSGKGLAGLRQAISLEVAFAPEACRAEPMRGLVLITMADAPGSARLVLGAGAWRWSDLLSARR